MKESDSGSMGGKMRKGTPKFWGFPVPLIMPLLTVSIKIHSSKGCFLRLSTAA